MGLIRDTSEKLLSGELSTEDLSPMTPRFELETVTPGVHFVSSFANVTAFETGDGLVLVDVGSFLFAERTREVLRSVAHAPVTHAIYTHGHVDHCFGVELYEAEPAGKPVHVVAHRGVERRFERYAMTRGYNSNINRRQFLTEAEFPGEFRRPNQTFEDALTLEVGGRSFQLHHAMGETDDHAWVFEPESRVLCTGDLFIWASPNCGNPQKVQRYPLEWAKALRAMAALDPEVLCPGHGVPIWGRKAVDAALTHTATYLETIVHQVLALMNDGARLDQILSEVRPPEDLQRLPYLRPVYDEPEFIVRNVLRLYGGWWDGNPANLKPARERDVARELTTLLGSVAPLVARAEELAAGGELKLACHLIEIAAAAPDPPASVFELRRKIYAQRAAAESSLMARGIFGTAARE
jgi:alkyl sulfatase BDS1-like metallo-beta-lactamase superfamily hydrolase